MRRYLAWLTSVRSLVAIGLLVYLWSPVAVVDSIAARAQPVPSSARAGVRSCSELASLRSQHSREPTKITFVNQSGMYRALNWVDFAGKQKSYGGLNSGERRTIDTFRTHPWVSVTGPGDCLQIFMPAAEPSTVVLK